MNTVKKPRPPPLNRAEGERRTSRELTTDSGTPETRNLTESPVMMIRPKAERPPPPSPQQQQQQATSATMIEQHDGQCVCQQCIIKRLNCPCPECNEFLRSASQEQVAAAREQMNAGYNAPPALVPMIPVTVLHYAPQPVQYVMAQDGNIPMAAVPIIVAADPPSTEPGSVQQENTIESTSDNNA